MVHMITSKEIRENGLEWMQRLYHTDSEVTGGEYMDEVLDNIKAHFERDIDMTAVMNAVQAFREWDCEDSDVRFYQDNSMECRYHVTKALVPVGTRVGLIHEGQMVLDKGIRQDKGRQYAREV